MADASLPTNVAEPGRRGTAMLRWLTSAWAPPLIELIVVSGFFQIMSEDGRFISSINLRMIAAQTALVAICSVGMTFIMIGGGIDLSVGAVAALCGVVLARMLEHEHPLWFAMLASVLVGGLCGLANGLIITSLRVIPFVVTLGMMGIARGLARAIAGNRIVRVPERPESLARFVQPLQDTGSWVFFAPSFWLAVVVMIIAAIVLNLTKFGRRTYALGDNETAARFSGLTVNRQKWWLYAIGGMLTGVSGIILFAEIMQGDPSAKVGLELQVIAAVVIGGGSLMGGEGSVFGTLLGALMLTALVNGCTLADWPNWVQEIAIGVIIILAVALDYIRRRRPA